MTNNPLFAVTTENTINWLLEKLNPSVRYRTLVELLDQPPGDPEVMEAKEQIPASVSVNAVFSHMTPDGFWYYQPRGKGGRGDGVAYYDFYTTHFNLAYLAELGMDREDRRIDTAVNRYLGLQQPDGDFMRHWSCLYAYNLRTFIRLGYGDEERVKRMVGLLTSTNRFDGGYLCDGQAGSEPFKPSQKSCIRGSVKALMAYADLPVLWETPQCQALIDYFIRRHGIYPSNSRTWRTPICPLGKPDELSETWFPFTWRATFLEVLYALSKMGHGQNPALDQCWALLQSKQEAEGRYILSRMEKRSHFVPTQQGEPCKWITLYALLAHKYAQS
jgi:rubredoxin